MMEPIRFIIITTPPAEISARIDEVRRRVCGLGGSRAALAYPPHVTLRTGASVPVESLSTFIDDFKHVVGEWDPFPVATDGFLVTTYSNGSGTKFLVGYLIRKDAAISTLNRRLLEYTAFRVSDRLEFQPHITLAFEDLNAEGYRRVDRFFEEHPEELPAGFQWKCDSVGLYRQEGDIWTPYVVYRMN